MTSFGSPSPPPHTDPLPSPPGGWRPLNRRVRQGSKIQLKVQPPCFKSSEVDFQLFLHPFLVILCVLLSLYIPISRFKPFFSYFASLFSRSTYKILFVVVLSLLTSHCSHFAFLLNSFASLLGSHLVSLCLLAGLLVTMKGFLWQLGLKMGLSPE